MLLPIVDKPILFIIKPGELSFGYREALDGVVHHGVFDGKQWISERLETERIGRAKMYRTEQIQDWWHE